MGRNKFAELSADELLQRENELRTELEMLNLKKNVGQMPKTSRFSEIRRDIAAVMTTKRALLAERSE
ncbi:MAG: 50S ribosomal protein L29 [Puniceicoccales bacterium]|jgi:ribosomal protein L29|nr:50S ribosomal protein L29 [Puniceicoccales bacterium]